MKELKVGNQNVFDLLLYNYQQKIFRTCISFIPNKEDLEDAPQEVFL
ncbi:hypothetical protein [Polaribacter sp. WD7]|nr:hypothetical protein [Polaribacter sp. WD7]